MHSKVRIVLVLLGTVSPVALQAQDDSPPRPALQLPTRLAEPGAAAKLELSLRSYLELVLANNTEIQIRRSSIEPQQNAIARAYAPFDPSVTTSFQRTRSNTPSQSALEGAATLTQTRQPFRVAFEQMLPNGARYSVGFDGSSRSSNDTFATFNPAHTANFNVAFTQPLLRNRGTHVNRLPILIARSRYEASRRDLEIDVMRLVEAAEHAYWAAIEAREILRVQEKALELLDSSLARYQKELELGAISPVDVYQPQQAHASQQMAVTQARGRLEQAENELRRQIGIDLDPALWKTPLVLTESVSPPSDDPPPDPEALVEMAIQKRPDRRAALQAVAADDLSIQHSRNALLPDLSLSATYSATGRGGRFIERTNVFSADGSEIIRTVPGGLGDALDQLFGFNYPTLALSLNLRLPIRDHRTAADVADATVQKRLNTLRIRAVEQQIRLEVMNARSLVESGRASLKFAQAAADLARRRVEAEQRKYDVGETTIFFLLDAQNSLTKAEGELVAQSIQHRRNMVNLLRATGALLEERGVMIQ